MQLLQNQSFDSWFLNKISWSYQLTTIATKNNRTKGIEHLNLDSEVLRSGENHQQGRLLAHSWCHRQNCIVWTVVTVVRQRSHSSLGDEPQGRTERRSAVSFPLPVRSHICSCVFFCQPRHQLPDVLSSRPRVGTSQLTYTTIYARNASKCRTSPSGGRRARSRRSERRFRSGWRLCASCARGRRSSSQKIQSWRPW